MRPFAPPQRLPVSRPPLRDHRSRPAPSPYCGVRVNPSASAIPVPVAGRPARTRVCCHAPRILDGSSPLRSPSGPFDPAGSSLAAIRRSKACLRRTPAFRLSPLRLDCSAASDHRFGFAAFRVARQLRKPLGTSIIVHRNPWPGQYRRSLSYNVFRRSIGLWDQWITLGGLWNWCG